MLGSAAAGSRRGGASRCVGDSIISCRKKRSIVLYGTSKQTIGGRGFDDGALSTRVGRGEADGRQTVVVDASHSGDGDGDGRLLGV